MWAMEILWGKKPVIQILSIVVGFDRLLCNGTIWFMVVYTYTTGAVWNWNRTGLVRNSIYHSHDLVKIGFGICLSEGYASLYQCSKKNVRHIPFALITGCAGVFIRNGYSTGYSPYAEMLGNTFYKRADVCLTVKTDEICSACPNNSEGNLRGSREGERYDNAVLAGMRQRGQKLLFPEFTEAVQKNH